MEKTNIGFKAGIILEKLGETGLITIAELARRLNFAADETALAAPIPQTKKHTPKRHNRLHKINTNCFAIWKQKIIFAA